MRTGDQPISADHFILESVTGKPSAITTIFRPSSTGYGSISAWFTPAPTSPHRKKTWIRLRSGSWITSDRASHQLSVRSSGRVLRAMARSAHGLLLRLLRHTGRRPGFGSGAEAGLHLQKTAALPWRASSGHWLRLGWIDHARRCSLRRGSGRNHAERAAGGTGPTTAARIGVE